MAERSEQLLLSEVACTPRRISDVEQQINLCWWDKFIEDIGERMKQEINRPLVTTFDRGQFGNVDREPKKY